MVPGDKEIIYYCLRALNVEIKNKKFHHSGRDSNPDRRCEKHTCEPLNHSFGKTGIPKCRSNMYVRVFLI